MDIEHRELAECIMQQAKSCPRPRYMVAVAGVPGSGKTTIAQAITECLNTSLHVPTRLLSMDGFHLPRSALDQLPNPAAAYARRGAPWTFDVTRFVKFIQHLRHWAETVPLLELSQVRERDLEVICAPTFDHETKDPEEDGMTITPDTSIIIIEGNYVLLDEPKWCEISKLVDYRVFVDTDIQDARDRIARRHVRAGIEHTLEDAYRRVDGNDYLNGLLVKLKLVKPDKIVKNDTNSAHG